MSVRISIILPVLNEAAALPAALAALARTRAYEASGVVADLTAADIASPGAAAVTVYTPPPGGGTSNSATMTISTTDCAAEPPRAPPRRPSE